MGRTVFSVITLMLAVLLGVSFFLGQWVDSMSSEFMALSKPIPQVAALLGQSEISEEQLHQLALATRQDASPSPNSLPTPTPSDISPQSSAIASANPCPAPSHFPTRTTRRAIFIQHPNTYPQPAAHNSPVQGTHPLFLSRLTATDIELALLIKLDTVVNLDLEPPIAGIAPGDGFESPGSIRTPL